MFIYCEVRFVYILGMPIPIYDRKQNTLFMKNILYKAGVKQIKQTKKLQTAINNCISKFADFNGCKFVSTLAGKPDTIAFSSCSNV